MIIQSPLNAVRRLFGPKALRPRKSDHDLVGRIRDEATKLSKLPAGGLANKTAELQKRVQVGEGVVVESILESAFAVVVVAMRQMMSIDLYDVQLLGGMALARNTIAEMQTGEGKTFTALLPAYFHALAGDGVHVMTVNAYLAKRDFELLEPVFPLLGFSVGLLEAEMQTEAKRVSYNCDITYGPGYEFGFDYLRDQVSLISRSKPRLGDSFRDRQRGVSHDEAQLMQRGLAVAIVDEADSVMMDEATTPLVLAGGGDGPAENADVYIAALHTAKHLDIDEHYVIDAANQSLRLTARAIEQLAARANQPPRRGLDRSWSIYVEQALRAERLFQRDVNYVVDDEDKICLVDQYTGRIFTDRTWADGLHQAVQAKEDVPITTETRSIARITRQRHLGLYKHLCGMTGTAQGGEEELRHIYDLKIVVIPPHKTCIRIRLPTRVFANASFKERAIVDDLVKIQMTGQPVLVGTTAIDTSERIARLLDERGISYQLLNGRQDAEESDIVAQAGQIGAVTIATNMAGRGTDIKLAKGVCELGGLHVICTEPQESTRIDRQLFGRAARQGDPGVCQQFAASDDELFTRYAPSLSTRILRLSDKNGDCRSGLEKDIAAVQLRIECTKARQRRQLFSHDDWLENVLRDLT